MLCYNTKLICKNETEKQELISILEKHLFAVNEVSKIQFNLSKNCAKTLHNSSYKIVRNSRPDIPSQVVIKAIRECLSNYRSIKSNNYKILKHVEKKCLSMRLDKRLYSLNKKDIYSINITTSNKRKNFKFVVFPKLKNLIDNYKFCDPLIFEKDGEIWISLTFKTEIEQVKQKLCLGVDLGIRVTAACSDGRLIIDKKFNKDKRKLRYLKRKLQSKGTRSAKRHLRKLKRKERNRNKNQNHLIANEILKTKADTIALENLKGIKAKKYKHQNKNRISQISFYELRQIITYKAANIGKYIVLVSPSYTSQIDSSSGKVEGVRKGRRFYSVNGLVYDADLNAARNIGQRSKLPVSYGSILDGQGSINTPNAQLKNVQIILNNS